VRTYVWGMGTFANAAPPLGSENCWPAFVWLAGLLEGEGTFLAPPPSEPRYPLVSCRMTDLDVIELAAGVFGTSIQAIDKGRYRTEFATTLKGSRAVELMRALRPMMSGRRQAAIDRALRTYSAPERKLSFDLAEEIRQRNEGGETAASLARHFGVSHPTIRAVLARRIYPVRKRFPWRPITCLIRGATVAGTGLNWKELYWLAGWLEGEGSFLKPPPSSPRSPRVRAQTIDRDVIDEAGRLLGIKPLPTDRARSRERGWSDSWQVTLCGSRAITLMHAIRPIMRSRRKGQIDAALTAAIRAGALADWHERNSFRLRKQRKSPC
jgi:hypothetical protein